MYNSPQYESNNEKKKEFSLHMATGAYNWSQDGNEYSNIIKTLEVWVFKDISCFWWDLLFPRYILFTSSFGLVWFRWVSLPITYRDIACTTISQCSLLRYTMFMILFSLFCLWQSHYLTGKIHWNFGFWVVFSPLLFVRFIFIIVVITFNFSYQKCMCQPITMTLCAV